MSFADREIVAAGLVASSKANLRTRSSSVDGRPRRRCASTSRAQSEMPVEQPLHALAQRQRAPSRVQRDNRGPGSAKSASRATSTPLVAAASRRPKPSGTSRGRVKEKGKMRAAAPEDHDIRMSASVDESWDADESSVNGRRNAKRRRLSPPPPRSLNIFDDEDDSQQTAVEEDFEMLDSPQSLPWVPMNPASQHSEYVPPGLNALIDDMKRALVLQISARQKAENLHAEELQRRLDLEQEAARLAAVNRALEAERSAWTRTVRAPNLRTPVSDPSPQPALDSEARLTPAAGDLPELGTSGFAGPSGRTADVEMAEATRTVSANRAVGASAEHGDGSPSGMRVRGATTAAPAV
ncbi:hypothetical protein V8D89_008058 [Ganoderma adspersum]